MQMGVTRGDPKNLMTSRLNMTGMENSRKDMQSLSDISRNSRRSSIEIRTRRFLGEEYQPRMDDIPRTHAQGQTIMMLNEQHRGREVVGPFEILDWIMSYNISETGNTDSGDLHRWKRRIQDQESKRIHKDPKIESGTGPILARQTKPCR